MMADTIWKYPLAYQDRQEVSLPIYAKILSVGCTRDGLFLWAKVSPVLAKGHAHEKHTILVVGTGNPMHDRPYRAYDFIGTVIVPTPNIDLVWHIFEEKSL
jgi:hypothetical protein